MGEGQKVERELQNEKNMNLSEIAGIKARI
jgi:hypothetical protein